MPDTRIVEPGAAMPPAVLPLSPSATKAANLVVEIFKRRSEKLQPKPPQMPTSLYASRIPDCERQGVYEFSHYKSKVGFNWELMALFQAGNVNEAAYKAQLRELGFDLVEDGAPLSDDMRRKYNIGGYLDTRIKWEGARIPIEMKLTGQHMFDAIDGLDANVLKNGEITQAHIERGLASMKRVLWFRKYLRQITTYLLGTGEEVGMFAFTDGRGRWKFVIVPLDYEEGERILGIAGRIKSHVEAGTLPDRIPYDGEICGRCPFLAECIPDIKSIPNQEIANNAQLAELVERRDQLLEKWSEVEKINKKIKTLFTGIKDGIFTIGNFIVTRKLELRDKYEVPDDVKEKYLVGKTEVFKTKYDRFAKPSAETIYLEPKRSLDLGDE